MVVLVTCKNEDAIKNEGARVATKCCFFWCSRADNSEVSVEIWQKLELFQVFMYVLVTCKNEDPVKNKFAGVATTFLPFKVYCSTKVKHGKSFSS